MRNERPLRKRFRRNMYNFNYPDLGLKCIYLYRTYKHRYSNKGQEMTADTPDRDRCYTEGCEADACRECQCGAQVCANCPCPNAVSDGEKTLWRVN